MKFRIQVMGILYLEYLTYFWTELLLIHLNCVLADVNKLLKKDKVDFECLWIDNSLIDQTDKLLRKRNT